MLTNCGSRIVRSEPGPGTAETIHTTEDGNRWYSNPMFTPVIDRQSTAPTRRVGRIEDGKVFVVG